jgi:hypothetical protein
MQGVGIGIAEDRYRAIAKRLRGAGDTAGDLAAVGDEDFRESDHSSGRCDSGQSHSSSDRTPARGIDNNINTIDGVAEENMTIGHFPFVLDYFPIPDMVTVTVSETA